MREIKFRAWYSGQMIEVGKIEFFTDGQIIVNDEFPVNSKDVMQFCGFKDKNEKDNQKIHGEWAIYEFLIRNGLTIISYIRSEKNTGIPEGYLASVYTDEFDVGMKTIMFANNVKLYDCEIIGNRYQHLNEIIGL